MEEKKHAMPRLMLAKRVERQYRMVEEGISKETLWDSQTCITFVEPLGNDLEPERTLSVNYEGNRYFPTWQFFQTEAGKFKPHDEMKKVLAILFNAGLNEWDAYFWFDSPNLNLDGEKPLEVFKLPDRVHEVVGAAKKITEEGCY